MACLCNILELHSINCACDAKRSIVPHEPCAPKCWKTKKTKKQTQQARPKTKNQNFGFGFWFFRKPKTKKTKNSDPTIKIKNQNLVFGFWFFRKPKAPKKTHAPFGFGLACWVCFFWFLVFQRCQTVPNRAKLYGVLWGSSSSLLSAPLRCHCSCLSPFSCARLR